LRAAMTSGVDLLRGLAGMMQIDFLGIPGVTDGLDNNFAGQAEGALESLKTHDLVAIHIEAPDEAGHGGNTEEKINAIEKIDKEVLGRLRSWRKDDLRMPDHPTPIKIRTHCPDPVPFLIYGNGNKPNGACRFTEAEAAKTGLSIDPGYTIMERLIRGLV
jgi:2,3-bisphosphoglycerate-independent phosphoglycerate mutase